MKIAEILKQDKFKLPAKRNDEIHIKDFIFHYLNEFRDEVIGSNNIFEDLTFPDSKFLSEDSFKATINDICDTFKKILLIYLNGSSGKAFDEFYSLMKKYGIVNLIGSYDYPLNSSFFRIRKESSNYPLKPMELFHIPFENIEKISTQRYSVPGTPSLYFGNSLFLCWEELNRLSNEELNCVKFVNSIKIKVLDFDWTKYYFPLMDDEIGENDLLDFAVLWPLFFVCNIKVPTTFTNASFKGEYIIPQLLTQFIKDILNDTTKGIRYNSTKIDYSTSFKENKHFNIALSVSNIEVKGHDFELTNSFMSSEVFKWNLHNFYGTIKKVANGLKTNYKNSDVKAISFLENGFPLDYKETQFYEIESILSNYALQNL